MITVKIADLPIAIDNKYSHVARLAADYLTDEEPLFTVSATDSEIEAERQVSEGDFPPSYLEAVVIYRRIAEQLPSYGAVVLHGAVLNFEGSAYAFTAKSGVGKTTHTRLWLRRFGDRVHYLNGDKPIVRFIDGTPYAYGTPWCGKEGYGRNERAPLRGIAFLERGEKNFASPADPDEVMMSLVTQVYIPRGGASALLAMGICDRILSSVRLVRLKCNMDEEAAEVSRLALTAPDGE